MYAFIHAKSRTETQRVVLIKNIYFLWIIKIGIRLKLRNKSAYQNLLGEIVISYTDRKYLTKHVFERFGVYLKNSVLSSNLEKFPYSNVNASFLCGHIVQLRSNSFLCYIYQQLICILSNYRINCND